MLANIGVKNMCRRVTVNVLQTMFRLRMDELEKVFQKFNKRAAAREQPMSKQK